MIDGALRHLAAAVDRSEFARFAIVGTGGFLVDTAVLYLCLAVVANSYYGGRLIAFLVGATFTWLCNRHFTFVGAPRAAPIKQWRHFLAVNAVGGAVNYLTYAALIASFDLCRDIPVLAVGAGSIAGLAFNFLGSKRFVFRASG